MRRRGRGGGGEEKKEIPDFAVRKYLMRVYHGNTQQIPAFCIYLLFVRKKKKGGGGYKEEREEAMEEWVKRK